MRRAAVVVLLAFLACIRPASATVMSPGDVLRVPFEVHKANFDPAVPDVLAISFDVNGVSPTFFDYTLTLFDGSTVLGKSKAINAFDVGDVIGLFYDESSPIFPILIASSPLFAAVATPAPFHTVQNGTIAGAIEFTFASDFPFDVELGVLGLLQFDLSGGGATDSSWVTAGEPTLVVSTPEPASGLLILTGLSLLGSRVRLLSAAGRMRAKRQARARDDHDGRSRVQRLGVFSKRFQECDEIGFLLSVSPSENRGSLL